MELAGEDNDAGDSNSEESGMYLKLMEQNTKKRGPANKVGEMIITTTITTTTTTTQQHDW